MLILIDKLFVAEYLLLIYWRNIRKIMHFNSSQTHFEHKKIKPRTGCNNKECMWGRFKWDTFKILSYLNCFHLWFISNYLWEGSERGKGYKSWIRNSQIYQSNYLNSLNPILNILNFFTIKWRIIPKNIEIIVW